jgi:integrase
MAGYVNLKGNSKPHRFIIHRKGVRPYSKCFADKEAGKSWAREEERSIELSGQPRGIEELKKVWVHQIVRKYLNEIIPTKKNTSEKSVLTRFRDSDLAQKTSLAFINKQDAYKWRNERLKEIKRSSVQREVAVIKHMFNVAREQWGYNLTVNPFSIPVENSKSIRRRPVGPEELQALLRSARNGCLGLNRLYVPLAIYLIAKTGLREKELCGLTWKNVDLDKRRIEIKRGKSKDKKQLETFTTVIPIDAWIVLRGYKHPDDKATDWVFYKEDNGRVTRMTSSALRQAFADVRKRAAKELAGVEDIQLQNDLRKVAGSWFDEAELTRPQHDLMMDHDPGDMRSVYVISELRKIQDKLDRHDLRGKTWSELTPVERKRREDQVLGGLFGFGGELRFPKGLANTKAAGLKFKRERAANGIFPGSKRKGDKKLRKESQLRLATIKTNPPN